MYHWALRPYRHAASNREATWEELYHKSFHIKYMSNLSSIQKANQLGYAWPTRRRPHKLQRQGIQSNAESNLE